MPEQFKPTQENIEKKEGPPEGWLSLAVVKKQYGKSRKYIENQFDPQKYPDDIKKYFDGRGTKLWYVSPLLQKRIREEFERNNYPPEGWLNNRQLTEKLGHDYMTVRNFALSFKEKHPEWFAEFLSASKRVTYYSPELVEEITKKINEFKYIEGWTSPTTMAKEIGRDAGTIIRRANDFREKHPEWFKNMLFTGGIREFYSPELVQRIRIILDGEIKVPGGWLAAKTLEKQEGFPSSVTIKKFISQFRESHPKWFITRHLRPGKTYEYYAPELIKKIKEEFDKYPLKKEGWFSLGSLSIELKRSPSLVGSLANSYRAEHPKWFQIQKTVSGLFEYYSPELVSKIREDLVKLQVPEGQTWLTLSAISNKYNISRTKIKKISSQYRSKHPEWFKVFISDRGHLDEHYFSELIKIIAESRKLNIKFDSTESKKIYKKTETDEREVDEVADRYIDPEGQAWISSQEIRKIYPNSGRAIARLRNRKIPQLLLRGKDGRKRIVFLKSKTIEEVNKLRNLENLPQTNKDGVFTDEKGKDWVAQEYFEKFYGYPRMAISKYIGKVNFIEGRSWKNFAIRLYDKKQLASALEEVGSLYKLPQVDESGVYRDSDGVGWVPKSYFRQYLNVDKYKMDELIASEQVPRIKGRDRKGKETNLYHKDHLEKLLVVKGYARSPEFLIPRVGSDWVNSNQIIEEFGISRSWLEKIINPLRSSNPEWFKIGKPKKGKTAEYFHPEVFRIISKEVEKFSKWKSAAAISKELSEEGVEVPVGNIIKFAERFKNAHPAWFHSRPKTEISSGKYLYSHQLVEIVKENFQRSPAIPEGWQTLNSLSQELKFPETTISKIAREFLVTNPEWSKKLADHNEVAYAPDLIDLIKVALLEASEVVFDDITPDELAEELGTSRKHILSVAEDFKSDHPEWFRLFFDKNGKSTFRFPKECADLIRDIVNNRKARQAEKETRKSLVNFLKEFESEKIESKEFRKLVSLFGGSRAMDILFKFRPEFRGLPVQYVKSVIADYIGDFLVVRHGYGRGDLSDAIEYLHEPNLKDGLLEVMKESCLEEYHLRKKQDPLKEDFEIIKDLIEAIRIEVKDLVSTDLEEVLTQLETYYRDLFKIEKPKRIVPEIKKGRQFPDLNQRINIKEISDKKRILIADEMGLGKSASAILAKESLGLKQALVVVPSNVIDTWRGYLDTYFESGQKPSVLVADSLEALEGDISGYEYILVSHERLTNAYTKKLLALEPDMLIVDEIHKLKNIKEGIRSDNLISLAEKCRGDDKYLAILSGTPVPNKIVDVAMILKLLYPEKFENISSSEMVQSIIRGDLIDLRSLLIPRMQMKSLRESIEMPQHHEQPPVWLDLNDIERDIYAALIEEDELDATQKIQILRQYLLNPEIVDATPGISSSKVEALKESLQDDFKRVNKIVVFVNNYVNGVVTGPISILPKLNLPADIEVRIIVGEVPKEERLKIQNELNASDKKMLLIVSGQTADVGVDFSGGEMVYFYNEPWTKADLSQQLARVYRPGLKGDLESKTFIGRGTIEEGIHRFIDIKDRSIRKLLRGVPLTELDREILTMSERQEENKEINPEVARSYFSTFDLAMKIFGENLEVGEREFMRYLDQHGRELTHGEEYAKVYHELGSRSYQANANRIAGALLATQIKERGENPRGVRILDLASGPEMLRKHSPGEIAKRVVSVDINPWHFFWDREKGSPYRTVGGLTQLPFHSESFDYANLTFALHYTRLIPAQGQFERLQVFREVNRVLKKGGRIIIDLVHNIELKDFEAFEENISRFGFKVVPDLTGTIESGEFYKSKVITLEKIDNIPEDLTVEEMVEDMKREQIRGFKLRELKGKNKQRLKDQRKIITSFTLGDREYQIDFNEEDEKIYAEEQAIIKKGEDMRTEHGSLEAIPREEIVSNSFVRYRPKKSYRLFRRLKVAQGGVVIK